MRKRRQGGRDVHHLIREHFGVQLGAFEHAQVAAAPEQRDGFAFWQRLQVCMPSRCLAEGALVHERDDESDAAGKLGLVEQIGDARCVRGEHGALFDDRHDIVLGEIDARKDAPAAHALLELDQIIAHVNALVAEPRAQRRQIVRRHGLTTWESASGALLRRAAHEGVRGAWLKRATLMGKVAGHY